MGIPLYTNNAATTLLAAITAGDGSLTVAAGTGALFPSPTGSDYAWLTLASTTGTEIVKCTARNGDTFTVTRGQQSTAALPFVVGDALTLRMTAAGLTDNVTLAAASAAAAAISAAAIPAPSIALDFIRVNAGATAYELRTPTQVLADIGAGSGDALVANPLSQFAATTSLQLKGVISDETGSGALVFADSPTLVTPALGTPSALVGTNLTGTAAGLSIGGNAATVTVADAVGDTTTWVLLGTAQTGNLAPATNTGLVYNATTQTFSVVSALDSTAVFGSTSGTGVGVHGRVVGSGVGIGVYANGSTNGTGVHGISGAGYGVRGVSTTNYGGSFSSIGTEGQITSTLATGTAPFVVASTTPVTNLSIGGNAATATNASTVTTNANLSGHVTSVGNTTSLGSFTLAQLNTAVSDANVVSIAGTETLTNKRNTKRITTEASSATPTINTDNCDIHQVTALAVAITSMTTNLTGTPVNGDGLIIEITDNATGRAITWGASFEASTIALPTTTVASAKLTTGFMWNTTTSKWRCVGVA